MIDGFLACLYLGALWYAAPLLDFADASLATRFRNLAFLGIGIPFALAFVHALYAPVVWIVVACLVFSRVRAAPPRTEYEIGEAGTLAVAVIFAWPAMVRPLLDGDTLLYHLPIAASWAQSHSLWTTIAPYWYYPPGSESFAAGLFCVAGRFALPLAGIVPALMLVARLYGYARARMSSWWASGLIAVAFLSTPILAFQVGTLQNDLWVAALFLEVLVAIRKNGALTLTALVKLTGWLWGILAAITARLPMRAVALSLIPLIAWIARDAILLWLHPVVPIASAPPYLDSTIAGHGAGGIVLLLAGLFSHSPEALVWISGIFAGLALRGVRTYAMLGVIGLFLFAFLPVTYRDAAVNHAATGESLRLALPALVCGVLIVIELARKSELIAGGACAVLAVAGMANVLMTFSNDGHTIWAPLTALLCIASVLTMRFTKGISAPVVAAALVIAAAFDAQTRAPDFYSAYMRDPQGKATSVFAWLAREAPSTVVAVNMRPGLVIMASPRTQTIPSGEKKMCSSATARGALLVIGSNEGDDSASERAKARDCGAVRYEDGAALVVQP